MSERSVAIQREVQRRLGRLAIERQAIVAAGCLQRCLPMLIRSAAGNALRAPLVPLAEEGLSLLWTGYAAGTAGTAGTAMDGASLAGQLRSWHPSRPEEEILTGDSSVLPFTQDLADLLTPALAGTAPSTMTDVAYNVIFEHYTWSPAYRDHDVANDNSGCLLELAVQTRHLEWLEREPPTRPLVDRIREHSVRAGEELLALIDEWYSGPGS